MLMHVVDSKDVIQQIEFAAEKFFMQLKKFRILTLPLIRLLTLFSHFHRETRPDAALA